MYTHARPDGGIKFRLPFRMSADRFAEYAQANGIAIGQTGTTFILYGKRNRTIRVYPITRKQSRALIGERRVFRMRTLYDRMAPRHPSNMYGD